MGGQERVGGSGIILRARAALSTITIVWVLRLERGGRTSSHAQTPLFYGTWRTVIAINSDTRDNFLCLNDRKNCAHSAKVKDRKLLGCFAAARASADGDDAGYVRHSGIGEGVSALGS